MKNLTKTVWTLAGLSLVLAFGTLARADGIENFPKGTERGDPAYLTVDTVQTYEVDALGNTIRTVSETRGFWGPNDPSTPSTPMTDPTLPTTGDPATDGMIQIGKAIWDIVVANAPKVTTATERVSIVPVGISDWRTLQGWSAPEGKTYRTLFRNMYGDSVVDFTYRVQYTYGGNLGGKGHFLSGVTIIPNNLEVAWGYTFNAKGSVANVTNSGTTENPNASAEIQMDWSIDTVLKHGQYSNSYYMRGDGTYKEVR